VCNAPTWTVSTDPLAEPTDVRKLDAALASVLKSIAAADADGRPAEVEVLVEVGAARDN
jgi:hypothetical protein